MCADLLRGPAEMLGSLSVSVLSYMLARQRTQNGKCVSVRGTSSKSHQAVRNFWVKAGYVRSEKERERNIEAGLALCQFF